MAIGLPLKLFPAELFRRLFSMAVGTTHFALLDLVQYILPGLVGNNQLRDGVFLVALMIEIKDGDIRFTAINTRITSKVFKNQPSQLVPLFFIVAL